MITSPLAGADDARKPQTPPTLDPAAPATHHEPPHPQLPGWIVEDVPATPCLPPPVIEEAALIALSATTSPFRAVPRPSGA